LEQKKGGVGSLLQQDEEMTEHSIQDKNVNLPSEEPAEFSCKTILS